MARGEPPTVYIGPELIVRHSLNPRAVKIHRTYTVDEIASLFGKHKRTVGEWFNVGLSPIDDRRPALVLGLELRRFIESRMRAAKRPCRLDQMFCFRCHTPQTPIGLSVELVSLRAGQFSLRGRCPVCETSLFRHIRAADLQLFQTKYTVRDRGLNDA